MRKKPVVLIIRDGWGKGKNDNSNAIYTAKTPFADKIESEYPTTLIRTDGLAVGLPEGSQGNSEVGHLTIGAGRVLYQSLTRIDKDIETGDFYKNNVFLEAINIAKKRNSTIHLMGLIQEEGVHATTHHAHALLELCKKQNFDNVLIHAITDGRDTPPKSANKHMQFLQDGIDKIGIGKVATVIGRYYSMDRDSRWDRTKLAYDAIMHGIGEEVDSWEDAISKSYAKNENDEFIAPKLINYKGAGKDDVIIFFNYRFDRTRQITKAIVEKDFDGFETTGNNIHFVAMTHYYDNGNFAEAFPPIPLTNILGEYISNKGLKQLRCAETEKYAHVTFFFNGQRNDPYDGEDRILINSPKVATYDLKPEMSIFKVKDKLVEAIESEKYDVIITNFANGDMVGHTGIFDAILKAVEDVDKCVDEVVTAALKKGGIALVTADHGNADNTKLADGSPMTSHTTNPVPISIIGAGDLKLINNGTLADIAPTMLKLLELEVPKEMTGKCLIKE